AYRSNILIMNVVRYKQHEEFLIKHLNIESVKKLLKNIKPELGVLTHFGRTMLSAKPWVVAEELSKELNIKVIAASDGFTLNYNDYL
ncbi:MBL fold metallo-hydrolase, partial [candidate division KSB1 bacterium]